MGKGSFSGSLGHLDAEQHKIFKQTERPAILCYKSASGSLPSGLILNWRKLIFDVASELLAPMTDVNIDLFTKLKNETTNNTMQHLHFSS